MLACGRGRDSCSLWSGVVGCSPGPRKGERVKSRRKPWGHFVVRFRCTRLGVGRGWRTRARTLGGELLQDQSAPLGACQCQCAYGAGLSRPRSQAPSLPEERPWNWLVSFRRRQAGPHWPTAQQSKQKLQRRQKLGPNASADSMRCSAAWEKWPRSGLPLKESNSGHCLTHRVDHLAGEASLLLYVEFSKGCVRSAGSRRVLCCLIHGYNMVRLPYDLYSMVCPALVCSRLH